MLTRQRTAVLSSPLTVQPLTGGGDARIVCVPESGSDKFGCLPSPEHDILDLGSSIAPTITPQGFNAAERWRLRLMRGARNEIASTTYARKMTRIRSDTLA